MDGHHGNTGKVEAPFQTENERKGIGPTSTEMGKHTENSKDERAENRKEASGASKGKEAQGYHKLGRFAQRSQSRFSERESGQYFGLQSPLRPYILTTPRNLLSLVEGRVARDAVDFRASTSADEGEIRHQQTFRSIDFLRGDTKVQLRSALQARSASSL